jgi:hypothetical protein
MTDQYRAPEEDAGKLHADAGVGRPQAGHDAPPDPVVPAVATDEAVLALSTVATSVDAPYVPAGQDQLPPKLYAHKNEVLYALGGLFIPGLVFLLMGGNKRTGILMLCSFVVSIVLCLVLVGVITLVATYIWSIVACFREARRQNEAHGFVS